jgi:hypothetical protein
MLPIEHHRSRIADICIALGVKRLDLVGSGARDDFDAERSDVDVLVEFEGGDHLFDRYFELKSELSEELGRKVDVIEQRAVRNPYVRSAIERDRVHLYGT